jgi:hypothetical protein
MRIALPAPSRLRIRGDPTPPRFLQDVECRLIASAFRISPQSLLEDSFLRLVVFAGERIEEDRDFFVDAGRKNPVQM